MNQSENQGRVEPSVNAANQMNVQFSDLYRQAIALWPENISVADGQPIGKGRYAFPKLSTTHDAIQQKIGEQNKWLSMMTLCIYEVSHAFSRYLAMSGVNDLRLLNVPVEDIALHVVDHLNAEWDADQATRFVNDSENMESSIDAESQAA